MFLTHFQFSTQPFAERVAAAALWRDGAVRQGLARLATWPNRAPWAWSREAAGWANPPS